MADTKWGLPSGGTEPDIAVILPCYNEEQTIGKVIENFRLALPGAQVWVCDNNSSDRTTEMAQQAGAEVIFEAYQGKGNAVRRLFAEVDADIYIMADGDETYDPSAAPRLVDCLIDNRLDMVNGARIKRTDEAYRNGHQIGNKLLTGAVQIIFGNRFKDMLSGYRVFSRRFVRSFPALSKGFEIETELTVHALCLRMPIAEIETDYVARPAGSASKLSTFKDGFRILRMIVRLVRDEKPLEFFGGISLLLVSLAAALFYPILLTYLQTGLVPRFPTLFVAVGLSIVSFLSFSIGLILDTQARRRVEARRFAYLAEAHRWANRTQTAFSLTRQKRG